MVKIFTGNSVTLFISCTLAHYDGSSEKEATRIRSTEEKSSQPYGETQIQSPEETGSQTVEEIQSQSAEDTIGKSVKRTFIQVHEESESMIVDGGDITGVLIVLINPIYTGGGGGGDCARGHFEPK